MRAAQVSNFGEIPQWIEVPDEQSPSKGSVQVKVLAVGVSNLVCFRAAGKHYSARTTPHRLGVDGAGRYLTGPHAGQKCIFNALMVGHSFQTVLNVPEQDVVPVPETTDLTALVGWLNPASSSWLAIARRTGDLPDNFTVLILGATTSSGKVAIDLVRFHGAKKVIGAARNEHLLSRLNLDQQIVVKGAETDWGDLSGIDVVLDYIWGPSALELLKSLPAGHRTQYITIGEMAGPEILLPSSLLRSKDLTINGSGIGSVSIPELRASFPSLVKALLAAPPREVRVERIEDISKVWNEEDDRRLVLILQEE